MRVRDVMTKDVVTVDHKTRIMDALQMMKQKKIKRLPVMKKEKFVGFVTRAMIRDASPSKATSLSIHELNYLLANMTVEEIMVKNPKTVSPDLPVEEAIWMGMQHGIGAFPVLEKNKLVGIITESDIAEVVINALGVGKDDSKRITIDGSGQRFGFLKQLVQVFDDHKIPILSMMSVPKSEKGDWFLIMRVKTGDAAVAVEDLRKSGFKVMDVT